MKSLQSVLIEFLCLVFIAVSCKQDTEVTPALIPFFSTFKSDGSLNPSPVEKNEIYYGLLTPVEICTVFDRLGIPYNNSMLNPIPNMENYLSVSKVAINTGVYGVDFGYLKIFGLGQEMIDYMVTIREMISKLGLPDKLLSEPVRRLKDDLAVPDTIASLMQQAYADINFELRKNNRGSASGLMIMGGWVEAMFIATQLVYNPVKPDPEVVEKIAEQKYTLTSLLSFMKNYYDDPVVVYYTKKLKYLKNYFDTFDIYFKKGDLEIDTIKNVFKASGSEMNVTTETLNNIRDYVGRLRSELITP